MATHTVGEIVYMAIDGHPPEAMRGHTVTCHRGWQGEGYLIHVAGIADSEMHAAKYTLRDRDGHDVPSNYR